jgi:hypothetical protein
MIVRLGDKEFEVSNEKLETTMKIQKSQFNDIIVHHRSTNNLQGLIFTLFCMKQLSEGIIEDMLAEIGVDKMGEIVTKTN